MTFFFEAYVRHPRTGEPGWDIQLGLVRNADDRQVADDCVRRWFGSQFDEFISLYQVTDDCTLDSPRPMKWYALSLDARKAGG